MKKQMNGQQLRQLLSSVFGDSDIAKIKYSSLYNVYKDIVIERQSGVCFLDVCNYSMCDISFTGKEYNEVTLKDKNLWAGFCRIHKQPVLPQYECNVIAQQSNTALAVSFSRNSPHAVSEQLEPFFIDFKKESTNE